MYFDALVVGDTVVEVFVDHSIVYCDISGEDLVQVVPKLVSSHLCADPRNKIHREKLLRDHFKVVVEISTDHYRRVDVLPEDVFDNLYYSECSVFSVESVSSFEVAIQNLDRLCPCVESGPAKVSAECLDQRKSDVVSTLGGSPASAFSRVESLVRPVVTKV